MFVGMMWVVSSVPVAASELVSGTPTQMYMTVGETVAEGESEAASEMYKLLGKVELAPQANNDFEKCPKGKISLVGGKVHIYSDINKDGFFVGADDYFSFEEHEQHSSVITFNKNTGSNSCALYSRNDVEAEVNNVKIHSLLTADCEKPDANGNKINTFENIISLTKSNNLLNLEMAYKRNGITTHTCRYLAAIP